MLFLLAFAAVATLEVVAFTMVWATLGPAWTIVLTLLTAVVGSFLVRYQGLGVWRGVRSSFNQGRFPGRELAHGAMILVGGALLLTPGFLTDVVGLALMVGPIREGLRLIGQRRLRNRIYIV